MANNLEWKLNVGLDTRDLEKQLRDLEQNIDSSVVNRLQSQINDLNSQLSSTTLSASSQLDKLKADSGITSEGEGKGGSGAGIGGSSKAISKGLSGIMSMAGKIFAGISVASVVMKALAPAAKMLSSIMSLLAGFLRPINDILMMMMRPVLALLRPALQIFNSMFAPFRQAMLRLSGQGSININTGILENDVEALKTGMLQSLLAVELGLAGLSSVFTKSIMTGIKGLTNVLSYLVQIIVKVISTSIGGLISIFPGRAAERTGLRVAALGGAYSGAIDASLNNMYFMLDTIAEKSMDAWIGSIINRSSGLGVDISDVLMTTMEDISYGEIFAQAWENSKDIFSVAGNVAAEILAGTFDEALKNYDLSGAFDVFASSVSETLTSSIEAKWQRLVDEGVVQEAFSFVEIQLALHLFKSNLTSEDIPGAFSAFNTSLQGFVTNIQNEKTRLDEMFPEPDVTEKPELYNILTDTDLLSSNGIEINWASMLQIEPLQETERETQGILQKIWNGVLTAVTNMNENLSLGFDEMLNKVNLFMGHSIIPDTFNIGLTHMQTSTTLFTNALTQTSGVVIDLVRRITDANATAQRAAQRAESYAASASRSASKARSEVLKARSGS